MEFIGDILVNLTSEILVFCGGAIGYTFFKKNKKEGLKRFNFYEA